MIIKAYCHINLTMLYRATYLKQDVQHIRNKEMGLQIVSIFPIYSRKYLSLSDLDLKVIWRKKIFQFKRHCSFHVKITYTNQNTSNNGEIDLNMREKANCMVSSGFCDLDLQTDNYCILSRYFNNVILCSIFLKEEAKYK